jgi:hypothetical protein
MKDSNFKTPRTLNECQWTPGYQSIPSDKEPTWQVVAGYVLAIVIGVGLAVVLFLGLSS